MGTAFDAVWLVLAAVSAACAIDATRRPQSRWAASGRDRRYWVTGLIVGVVFFPIAPFVVGGYLLGVLPKLLITFDGDNATFRKG